MTDIKKIYGKYVFNDKAMKKYIPKETYDKFKKIINDQKDLPDNMAKIIAKAMCNWAIDNGAAHYTHWFQPLTNTTAENEILKELVFNVNNLKHSLDLIEKKLNISKEEKDIEKKSILFRDNLIPAMDEVRKNVDILEMLVGKNYWPIPSYGDLIFEVAPL